MPAAPSEKLKSPSGLRASYQLIGLFILLVIAIGAVTYRYHVAQTEAIEREVRNQLLAIADMKVRQIAEWRVERIGDAQAIMADRMSLAVVARYLARAGGSDRDQILTWMEALCNHVPYADAILADAGGRIFLATGRKLGDTNHLRALVSEVIRKDEVVLRDFHRDGPSGVIHLGLNIPLRLDPESPPFGALLLGIDPEDYLYPLLQQWPIQSSSGETLLVRREGDQVLFLNNLRYRAKSAMSLRAPLGTTGLPAALAVRGVQGAVEGKDYRGVPVFAAMRSVPNTPWFLVAKLDAQEVMRPFARRSVLVGVTGIALILAAAGLVGFIWRRQQVRFYRESYEAEVERRAAIGRAQAALQQSEERFRRVVENAPEGILVESGLEILYVNRIAIRLLGADKAGELVGRSLLDVVDPAERDAVRERSSLVARGEDVPATERTYVRLDGEPLPAEVSAVPVEYDRRPASLVFFRDIRERKRTEAERASLEAQLLQAQKMESVGRLAGGVAHDFNNHLTVINGYCDMLLSQLHGEDPLRESLEEIRSAGDRAGALTQQLLAFSRKQIAEPKPISLNDVVTDAGKMLRRLISEDIEIMTRLTSDPTVVIADRGQMNQVLLNLAVNARDAMPRGGALTIETAAVEVDDAYKSLHAQSKPGRYVTLTVSDTGAGMTREVQEKIFEPFFTTKKTGAGTGLGLATVYGIVRQCDGWIRVYSEPDKGAVFQVYLPRADQGLEPLSRAPDEGTALRGFETVLVVEDQEEVRRLTLAILGQRGYRLLEASNGTEALEVCAKNADTIDLLLTDVVMPGMNGRELATKLVATRPSLKVLYTSGYTADAIGRGGALEPGVAYLPKPFTAVELAAKVREVLEDNS